MKNKKIYLISAVFLILIILISIYIFNYFNSSNMFKNVKNEIVNGITNELSYKTITVDSKFKLNVAANFRKENIIIDNVDYNADYQIDLENGYINVDLIGNYNKEKLESNIYINNKVNILLKNTFDKYISYDIGNYNMLNNTKNYKEIMNILNEEINELLKPEHFTESNEVINSQEVTKITLDLSKDYYEEIKKNLISNLSNNKKFIKNYSNIYDIQYSKKELIKKMNYIDMKDYKITMYISKSNKELVRLEIDSKKKDLNVEYRNNKYNFEYYENDGLMYKGYIKSKNNKLDEINIENILDNYFVSLKFDELNINYNKKTNSQKTIDNNNLINNLQLTESDKNNIRKNKIINEIYKNYLNRFYHYEDDGYNPEAFENIIEN